MDPPVVNAWLMHRKDCTFCNISKKYQSLPGFKMSLVACYDSKIKENDQVYEQWKTKLKKGRGPTADVFISGVRND
jgi:hypothetical protein